MRRMLIFALVFLIAGVLHAQQNPWMGDSFQRDLDTLSYDATKSDIVPECITLIGAVMVWNNMPDAVTELPYAHRLYYDFSNADSIRYGFRLAAAGTDSAELWFEYAADEWTWATLTDTISLASAGTVYSDWTAIPEGAKGDQFVRIVGHNGDGIEDPSFRVINIQLK